MRLASHQEVEGLVTAAQQALQAKQPQPLEIFGRGKRQRRQLQAATAPQQLGPSSKGQKRQLPDAGDWQPNTCSGLLHAAAHPEAAVSSQEHKRQAPANSKLLDRSSKRQKQLLSPMSGNHADAGTRPKLSCVQQASRKQPAVLSQAPIPHCQEQSADAMQQHEVLAAAAVSRQSKECQDPADADGSSPISGKDNRDDAQETPPIAVAVPGLSCASRRTGMLPPASVQQRAGLSASCIVAAAVGTAAVQLPPEPMQRPAFVLPAVADQPCGQPLLIPIRQAHASQGPFAALFQPSPNRPRCGGPSCRIPFQHAACLPLMSEGQRDDPVTGHRSNQGQEVGPLIAGLVKTQKVLLQPADCKGVLLAAALHLSEA